MKNNFKIRSKKYLKKAKKMLLTMHMEAGVGHIGGNLSILDALVILVKEFLGKQNILVLSKGHSAGALYVALSISNHIDKNMLKTFHQDDTLLAGHPPSSGINKITFATGSLGHGLSLAAGSALALKMKKQNNIVYCIMSDGEWQEGSTWEALIFLSHNKLNNLKVLIDHNQLQGYGSTNKIASMDPLWSKIKNFNVIIDVINGHSPLKIESTLRKKTTKPHFIFLKTTKGNGIENFENKMESHYLPISKSQYKKAIDSL